MADPFAVFDPLATPKQRMESLAVEQRKQQAAQQQQRAQQAIDPMSFDPLRNDDFDPFGTSAHAPVKVVDPFASLPDTRNGRSGGGGGGGGDEFASLASLRGPSSPPRHNPFGAPLPRADFAPNSNGSSSSRSSNGSNGSSLQIPQQQSSPTHSRTRSASTVTPPPQFLAAQQQQQRRSSTATPPTTLPSSSASTSASSSSLASDDPPDPSSPARPRHVPTDPLKRKEHFKAKIARAVSIGGRGSSALADQLSSLAVGDGSDGKDGKRGNRIKKDPSAWSVESHKLKTRFNLVKFNVVWKFVYKGEKHHVELYHSQVSGKRKIVCDGREILNEKKMFDSGSRNPFAVGYDETRASCCVVIRESTLDQIFDYELEVEGQPFAMARAMWLDTPEYA